MNDKQRKELTKAQKMVQEAQGIVGGVRDENQESWDNMPEGLQNGEKGERLSAALEELCQAVSDLETVDSSLESAIGA